MKSGKGGRATTAKTALTVTEQRRCQWNSYLRPTMQETKAIKKNDIVIERKKVNQCNQYIRTNNAMNSENEKDEQRKRKENKNNTKVVRRVKKCRVKSIYKCGCL